MGAVNEAVFAGTSDLIVRDFMCVQPGESVVITADTATDPVAVKGLFNAAQIAGARAAVVTIPQMPFQGALSDPYIPGPVGAILEACDVWLDMTFPYMAGSQAHARAMKTKRVRCLELADLDSGGIQRLFGGVDFDRLHAVQGTLDALVEASVGKTCRVTNPRGTDISFVIDRPATRKLRHANVTGTYTPPGSAVIYPKPDSVAGVVVIEAAFHEYHTHLSAPITLEVDGRIRNVSGGAGSDIRALQRSLLRAGGGQYGSIIHFSHGFHPRAQFNGRSFIEDIRVPGHNAIGFGIPWWEEGGGENHPDGVVTMQSMWIDGEEIVHDGAIVAPGELVRLDAELNDAILRPRN